MTVSWKLVRSSIALSLCVGMLAACQDRGQFKSKTWTPEQIKKNFADKTARENGFTTDTSGATTPAKDATVTTQQKPLPAPGSTDQQKQQVATNNGGTPTADATKPADGKPATGAAQSQVLNEPIPASQKFIEDNQNMLKVADALAIKTFPAISVLVEPNGQGSLAISIESFVKIGAELRYFTVAATPIGFSKDGKVSQLTGVLKANDTDDTLAEGQVVALASCNDEPCSEMQVRISTSTDAGVANAAILIKSITPGDYETVDSNLKDQLKDINTFQNAPKPEDGKLAVTPVAPVAKADAPKADAPKADAPKVDAPKADAPKADAPKADAPKADVKQDAAKDATTKTPVTDAKTDAAKSATPTPATPAAAAIVAKPAMTSFVAPVATATPDKTTAAAPAPAKVAIPAPGIMAATTGLTSAAVNAPATAAVTTPATAKPLATSSYFDDGDPNPTIAAIPDDTKSAATPAAAPAAAKVTPGAATTAPAVALAPLKKDAATNAAAVAADKADEDAIVNFDGVP